MTNEHVREIVEKLLDDWPMDFLADEYGVSIYEINAIRLGQKHREISLEYPKFRERFTWNF